MKPRILVVGDGMVDEWVIVQQDGYACEPHVPRYREVERFERPGGARNVCRQLERHECDVRFVGTNGTRKVRFWDGERVVARMDYDRVSSELEEVAIVGNDVVVLSDYGKGALTSHLVRRLIKAATSKDIPVIVDPKNLHPEDCAGALLKCNEAYRQKHSCDVWDISQNVIVTNAERATHGVLHGKRFVSPLQPVVNARCVVGAGDCFVAHLALAWARGIRDVRAVEYADRAARQYVTRPFGELVFPHEADGTKRVTAETAAAWIGARHSGKTTVVAGGCFDILHPGHLALLRWAKAQGDVLVVLINDDNGVAALKGARRPAITLHDRVAMLEAMDCVDLVVPFAGVDPVPSLQIINPSLYVKGPECSGQEGSLPEAGVCEVRVFPGGAFKGHSSDLVRRWRI